MFKGGREGGGRKSWILSDSEMGKKRGRAEQLLGY
jgi:hypothetical protein